MTSSVVLGRGRDRGWEELLAQLKALTFRCEKTAAQANVAINGFRVLRGAVDVIRFVAEWCGDCRSCGGSCEQLPPSGGVVPEMFACSTYTCNMVTW